MPSPFVDSPEAECSACLRMAELVFQLAGGGTPGCMIGEITAFKRPPAPHLPHAQVIAPPMHVHLRAGHQYSRYTAKEFGDHSYGCVVWETICANLSNQSNFTQIGVYLEADDDEAGLIIQFVRSLRDIRLNRDQI